MKLKRFLSQKGYRILRIAAPVLVAVVLISAVAYSALTKNSAQVPTVTPSSTPATSHPTQKAQPTQINFAKIKFDGCGKITKYTNEPWYASFQKAVNNYNLYYNLFPENASDACFSPEGNLLIFIIPGNYADGPEIFQFDVITSVLKPAILIDHGREFLISPLQFSKREGNIIHLIGKGGDAGCGGTQYFEYDLVKNEVEVKREYTICEGEQTGTWHYY